MSYESINLSAGVDEDPNFGGSFLFAFYRKSGEDSGLHLVAKTSNSGTNTWRDIPCGCMLQLKAPRQQTCEDRGERDIRQPQAVGRTRVPPSLSHTLQEPVRYGSADLLA